MPKKQNNIEKTYEVPVNQQQKIVNSQKGDITNDSGINQPHNAKKVALGPNTRR